MIGADPGFVVRGAKFGEGFGDRLGPQSGQGRSPVGGGGGPGGRIPQRPLHLSDFRAKKSCIFMSKLPSPVAVYRSCHVR